MKGANIKYIQYSGRRCKNKNRFPDNNGKLVSFIPAIGYWTKATGYHYADTTFPLFTTSLLIHLYAPFIISKITTLQITTPTHFYTEFLNRKLTKTDY